MDLKTVIKLSIVLHIFCYTSYSQNNDIATYHILFESDKLFNADKKDITKDKILFGMTTEQKRYFPKKYLFAYDKSRDRVEIPEKEVKKINFSNIHKVYWEYKKSKNKTNIFLYEYKEENCYFKYSVTIEFPPPPPLPDTWRGHGIKRN